ncbi:MAG: hypothetical protein J0M12_12855 [Deltaproteobacteria bacterium]|nr:hypothetical protein [Deltaproteobacteria bacterium]
MSEDTRTPFDISILKNDIKLARLAQEKPVVKWQAEELIESDAVRPAQESVQTA